MGRPRVQHLALTEAARLGGSIWERPARRDRLAARRGGGRGQYIWGHRYTGRPSAGPLAPITATPCRQSGPPTNYQHTQSDTHHSPHNCEYAMAVKTWRSTTVRDRHRRIIAQSKPPCGICGGAIDYNLPYFHPESFVVDHMIPLKAGGKDTLDNKQAAHRACNRAKSDKIDGGPILRRSGSLRRVNRTYGAYPPAPPGEPP